MALKTKTTDFWKKIRAPQSAILNKIKIKNKIDRHRSFLFLFLFLKPPTGDGIKIKINFYKNYKKLYQNEKQALTFIGNMLDSPEINFNNNG